MSNEAEIKKIVLDISGVEIALTPEQAKRLYELLDELYGCKTVYMPSPSYPIIIREQIPYWT